MSPQKHQEKALVTAMFTRFSLIVLSHGAIRRLIVLCRLLMESKSHVLLPSISREHLNWKLCIKISSYTNWRSMLTDQLNKLYGCRRQMSYKEKNLSVGNVQGLAWKHVRLLRIFYETDIAYWAWEAHVKFRLRKRENYFIKFEGSMSSHASQTLYLG